MVALPFIREIALRRLDLPELPRRRRGSS